MAADLKADTGECSSAPKRPRREVKRLSASGELAKYRMLHFATHGAIAGELDGTASRA